MPSAFESGQAQITIYNIKMNTVSLLFTCYLCLCDIEIYNIYIHTGEMCASYITVTGDDT